MDKAELLKKLKECKNNSDKENAHWDADYLLIEYINDEDIKEAFRIIPKWYA